jgi:hypothetical protein
MLFGMLYQCFGGRFCLLHGESEDGDSIFLGIIGILPPETQFENISVSCL